MINDDNDVDDDNDNVEIQQIKNLKVHLQKDKKELKKNTNVNFAINNIHITKTN